MTIMMTSVEVTSQVISGMDTSMQLQFTSTTSDGDEDDIISVKKVKGNRKALIDSDDEESDARLPSLNPPSPGLNSETQEDSASRSSAKSDRYNCANAAKSPDEDSSNELEKTSMPPSPGRYSSDSDDDLDKQSVRKGNSDSENDQHKESVGKGSGSDSDNCEYSIDQIKSKYYENKRREYNTTDKRKKKRDKTESEGDVDAEKRTKQSSKQSKTATNRKAKLAALEEIHSVTQRFVRESSASLPYHNPKPRSLEDFLNRRKTQPKVPLKTHVEELSKVWKFTEDQEKTAEIVYKPEDEVNESSAIAQSENDSSNNQLVTNEVIDKTDSTEDKPESKVEESATDSEVMDFHLSELTEGFFVQNSVTQLEPLTAEEESALKGKPSEPVGDPTFEDDRREIEKKTDAKTVTNKELFHNSVISVKSVPKLSGDPSGMIELDDFPKSGTLGFIKRYMKHSALKPKEVIDGKVGVEEGGSKNVVGSEATEEKTGERPSKKALKANLHKKIVALREQQLAKRVEEYKIAEDEFFGVDEEAEDDISKFDEFEFDEKEEAADEKDSEKEDEVSEEELLGDNVLNEDGDEEEDEKDLPFLDDKAEEVCDGEQKENESSEEVEEESIEDLLSNEPMPEKLDLNLDEEVSPVKQSQLLDLCSGKFSSQALNLSESEDEAEDTQNENSPLTQSHDRAVLEDSDGDDIIGSRPKKKVRKLSFSDDEDDESSNKTEGAALPNEEDDEAPEEDEILEEEDEREEANDELVEDEEELLAEQLGKDFLEGEAELSESEWGSADEDERNLDEFELEEGDREKFSQRRLRRELEQIHARELMAEDKRKIRIMQELFLEDGELHTDGPKRQRLFRWYNQDETDADGPLMQTENNENDFGDEEDEETWRKGRIERESFLRQQKIDVMESQDNDLLSTTVRTVILKATAQLNDSTNASPIIQKSPDDKKHFSLLTNRGSFLSRGEKILSKIAELTTGAGTGDARKFKGGNNRNMVFAVVSPEKVDSKAPESSKPTKRKAEVSQDRVKKLKHIEVKKPSFLDRLRDEDT